MFGDRCFLFNTDGKFMVRRESPTNLLIGYFQDVPLSGVGIFGAIGLYPVGGSPLDAQGKLMAPILRVGSQNRLMSIGVEVNTLVDDTGVRFFPAQGSKDPSRGQQIMGMSVADFPFRLHALIVDDIAYTSYVVPNDSITPLQLQVSNFVQRQTIVLSKSVAEILAEVGGAISAFAAIIGLIDIHSLVMCLPISICVIRCTLLPSKKDSALKMSW